MKEMTVTYIVVSVDSSNDANDTPFIFFIDVFISTEFRAFFLYVFICVFSFVFITNILMFIQWVFRNLYCKNVLI